MSKTTVEQRRELFNNIHKILDDLRGKVRDKLRDYVLVFLFYRFISENITYSLYEREREEDPDFNYESLDDNRIPDHIKKVLIDEKGFFIAPSQLFNNVIKRMNEDNDLNITLKKIFESIQNSSKNTKSEREINGLFDDIDLSSKSLGETVNEQNKIIRIILNNINKINLGNYKDHTIDIFGDAYEYICDYFATHAGKSGGEFYTPPTVSELVSKLAIGDRKEINCVYDPACGSGSLLLKAIKILGNIKNIKQGFYGQEYVYETYNLCRMNMFLHDVLFNKFFITRCDTLKEQLDPPNKYDVIVCNPPYSQKWEGKNNPLLINDPRFAPAGVLAPVDKSDYAFILHCLYNLSPDGKAAIVCFPGIFYRGGAEQKIRKYLVDNNFIDLIIALPPDLFYGTTISTCIMVLNKHKTNKNIMFIDASNDFEREDAKNRLSDQNINHIVGTYNKRQNIEHYAIDVPYEEIVNNDYNLSVSTYIEPMNEEVEVDIKQLNYEIDGTVNKIDELRKEINLIIKELENEK